MAEELTDEQLTEIEDNFKLFSKDGGEHIATKQLGTLIRSMGQHPTQAEIEDLIRLADVEETGFITFPKFKTLLSRIIKDLDAEKQLRDAFRVFDKEGSGFIASSELRLMMSTLGEVLTSDEVEEFIREADGDGRGFVSYEDFIHVMISK